MNGAGVVTAAGKATRHERDQSTARPARMGRLWPLLAACLAVGLVALLGLVFAGPAGAEPYFSVREGYKCSRCHVNRTGGGKRTDYGLVYMQTRMAAGSTQALLGAMGAPDGDGEEATGPGSDFPHGHLNEHVSLGADLRMPYTARHPDTGSKDERFGRESSCASCHAATSGGGKLAEAYLQADLVPERALIYAGQNLQPRVDTREFFALVQGMPLDGYVKAGTFRLPGGLSTYYDDPMAHGLAGDTAWLPGRGVGVEVGLEPGPLSVTLSVTNPGLPEEQVDTTDKRYAGMAYVVGGWGLAGLSYRVEPTTVSDTRTTFGTFAGLHLGRLTALAQFDQIEDDEADTKPQLALAELDVLAARGHNVKLVYEYLDPDTETSGNIVDRTSLIYEPFWTPNLQTRVGLREGVGPKGDAASNYSKAFVELHLIF